MTTLTAAQRRADAKAQYNAFLVGCPSRQLLDTISDKWVALVLAAVAEGSAGGRSTRGVRYSDLGRRVAGISSKMLTQTLRALERDGLIDRTVIATVPVTVTYSVTALGQSLQDLLVGVKDWAEQHMDAVLEHRRAAAADRGAEPAPTGHPPVRRP